MLGSTRLFVLTSMLCIALVALSCAPGNERWNQDLNPGHRAGFWAGLWHGLVIVITFVVSLFTRDVNIYEVNNVGWPYNLGFIIGLCFSFLAPWRRGIFRKKKKETVVN